ncbi:MAG: ribbon-helix-helix protein, CopG family [Dermatophilaceae bacterium]|nr:ribbon-helix-helix protein, CopG family [Actinomycetales bacterium]MBP8880383.1 ribbon-helix-helix protein, CopG family [Dermatophilaceae bacterium]MBP9917002.1 ribbon-helix-helix protein, CopG family [Dermatophilaceae bacterium]
MTVINFRCDDETLRALDELGEEGETRSDTLRRAIRDARVLRRREQMRREAVSVAADPADLEEAKAVTAQMGALRAW